VPPHHIFSAAIRRGSSRVNSFAVDLIGYDANHWRDF
jgi:hypothetical protein